MNRMVLRALGYGVGLFLVGHLAACSSVDVPQPTPLKPLEPLLSVSEVWQAPLGGEVGDGLRMAAHDNLLAAATLDGLLRVIDTETGETRWSAQSETALIAGVGFDGKRVAAIDTENGLQVFEAGKHLWTARLPARSYTQPLLAGGRVFVLLSDRRVGAFDADTGAQLWLRRYADSTLVLAHPGLLAAVANTLAVGLGERFSAINPDNGALLWSTPLVRPRGIDELERLADWVSGAVFAGTRVCGQAFQNAVGCIDLATRRAEWTVPSSGVNGLAGDVAALYSIDATGKIFAMKTDSGASIWTQRDLLLRGLTAPLLLGQTIAIGDFAGYVHWLSRTDGQIMTRMSTDGSPIVGAPLLVNGTAVAVTKQGTVYAWRPQ